jgi:hypothetical protein
MHSWNVFSEHWKMKPVSGPDGWLPYAAGGGNAAAVRLGGGTGRVKEERKQGGLEHKHTGQRNVLCRRCRWRRWRRSRPRSPKLRSGFLSHDMRAESMSACASSRTPPSHGADASSAATVGSGPATAAGASDGAGLGEAAVVAAAAVVGLGAAAAAAGAATAAAAAGLPAPPPPAVLA